MSPVDAARLRALAEKATKGPWYPQTFDYATRTEQADRLRERLDFSDNLSSTFIRRDSPDVEIATTGNGPTSVANGDYIAALPPEKVLALLDAHKLAREALAKIESTGPFHCADRTFVEAALRISADTVARLDALVTPEGGDHGKA